MRLIFLLLIICTAHLYAQQTSWSVPKIKSEIHKLPQLAILVDSLNFIDSTCHYLKDGAPYSGYVIYRIDRQVRFNLFEAGKYIGEEWVFDSIPNFLDPNALIPNLREFRVLSDTNSLYTEVTSYYDFEKNQVSEIYCAKTYTCLWIWSVPGIAFDAIFDEEKYRELPYKSFYENGNKKEESIGTLQNFVNVTKYYENGQKESVIEINRNKVETGMIKKYSEDGKCTLRLKSRNAKLRGFYMISNGKMTLSIIARNQHKRGVVKR